MFRSAQHDKSGKRFNASTSLVSNRHRGAFIYKRAQLLEINRSETETGRRGRLVEIGMRCIRHGVQAYKLVRRPA